MKKIEGDLKAYLGPDAVFKGTLNFSGVVRVDGKFEGKVVTNDTLIIGESGDLNAEIIAGTVVCKGRVNGTMQGSKRIEIHSKSHVVGNIRAPSLYVEVGAVFDGQCNMTEGESKIIPLVKAEDKQADAGV